MVREFRGEAVLCDLKAHFLLAIFEDFKFSVCSMRDHVFSGRRVLLRRA